MGSKVVGFCALPRSFLQYNFIDLRWVGQNLLRYGRASGP